MFLYTSNNQLENVLLHKMPFTIAIKASKYLGISLHDIFMGKIRKLQYETLKKIQTFHDLIKGKTHTQIGSFKRGNKGMKKKVRNQTLSPLTFSREGTGK